MSRSSRPCAGSATYCDAKTVDVTLRTRLVIASAGLALVLAASAVTVLGVVQSSLVDEIDRQLGAAAPIIANPVLTDGTDAVPPPTLPGGPAFRVTELYIGRFDARGRLQTMLQGSGGSAPPRVSLATARTHASTASSRSTHPFTATSRSGDEYRVVAVAEGTQMSVLALPTNRIAATYRSVRLGVGIVTAVMLALLVLAGWWVARLGLRPIREVTDAAVAISAGDLDHRVAPQPRGTEAGQLAFAFNTMVDERQAAERRLRQFVADASHELRTPLSTVAGVLELYRSGTLPDLDDALGRAANETARMSGLVTDLLLLARLDQGLPLAHDSVDLSRLVEDAAFDVRIQTSDRSVTTRVTAGVVVEGDEARLKQVVANLVTNAVTHTGPTVPITMSVVRDGDWCTLAVRDDGPGMTAEQAAHIFDRFYRIDRGRARATGGSGLGLSIVASIVAAHHGRITVDSMPGEGTTFQVDLPRSC